MKRDIDMIANKYNNGTSYYYSMKRDVQFDTKIQRTWWQEQGLSYTASGYGSKIPTDRMVRIFGRWHRVYCSIFSNSGVCYVIVQGRVVYMEEDNMEVTK